MFRICIKKTKTSIFPIIASIKKNDRVINRVVAGTGFFIDDDGHFVTALHVVENDKKNIEYSSLGNIPNITFSGKQPEPIIPIAKIKNLDLFIGKLQTNVGPPIKFAKHNPQIGTSIVVGGYPFPQIAKSPRGGRNFYTVRQYWQSTMVMGFIPVAMFDRKRNYQCFLSDRRTIPGMSGGPALDRNGDCVGMCTSQISRMAQDKIPNVNGIFLECEELKKAIKLYSSINKAQLN